MKAHFMMMARYNAWANDIVYDAAAKLTDRQYRADLRCPFKSVHGTLNHLLAADHIWMNRFTGTGKVPRALNVIMESTLPKLRARRVAFDQSIVTHINELSEDEIAGNIAYVRGSTGETMTQPRAGALVHFFNHQTHHRGHVHAMLSRFTGNAPSLDLLEYQRVTGDGMGEPAKANGRRPPIRFSKVFGERNTGTNFMDELVKANCPELRHIMNVRLPMRTLDQDRRLDEEGNPAGYELRLREHYKGLALRFAIERYKDLANRPRQHYNFGWKHSAVSIDEMRDSTLYDKTAFVFVVRNPYQYLLSLHRRPYALLPIRPMPLARFIRHPIIPVDRDNLPDHSYLTSPLELWNLKVRSYMEAVEQCETAVLFRYEDVVVDPETVGKTLSALDIKVRNPIVPPEQATKSSDTATFDEYRKRVLTPLQAPLFNKEDTAFIRSVLDADLCETLGYDPGDPYATYHARPA